MSFDTSTEIKLRFFDDLIRSQKERNARLMNSISSFTTKAQINITISGLFVATIFGLVKDYDVINLRLKWFGAIFLVMSVAFFMLSVTLSVLLLFVGKIPVPNDYDLLRDVVSGVVVEGDDPEEIIISSYDTLCKKWDIVNDKLSSYVERKASKVFISQLMLVFGVLVMAIYVIGLLLKN
jgi:hypothetical protein